MRPATLSPLLEWVLCQRGEAMPDALRALSDRLPAVPCAGLEIRLDAGEDAVVDLQLGLRAPDDVARLRHWLAALPSGGAELPAAWAALRDALERGLLDLPFREVWLELDGGSQAGWPPVSVFIRLADDVAESRLEEQLLAWLACLGRPVDDALRQGIRRCLEGCGPGQRVTHLGCMLGRTGAPLRLIVDGTAWDGCAAYLDRAGWPANDRGALQSVLDDLYVHFDRIRLALDLAADGRPTPALGLECFLGSPDAHDRRWPRVLEALSGLGLCTGSARRRLGSWHGVLTPGECEAPWPDSLMVDAIVRDRTSASWLDLRVSHVKVAFDGAAACRPKGYIGFMETIAAPAAQGATVPPRAPRPADDPSAPALDFLLAARTAAGWWHDYPGFSEGIGDEWVTAYVGYAVALEGTERGRAAAERAWSLLSRRDRDGWGWNHVQPADADSTLWALRLAGRLGREGSERARRALEFLRRHVLAHGGVATYLREHHRAWSGHVDVSPGWFDGAPCVTAAAANVRGLGPEPGAHLLQAQHAAGHWTSYWWADDAYATSQAVEALAASPAEADRLAVDRARGWAERRLAQALVDGGPATACSVAWLVLVLQRAPSGDRGLLGRARRWLADAQLADGSWEASAHLSIPNVRGERVPAIDRARLMTTATVLQALQACRPAPA